MTRQLMEAHYDYLRAGDEIVRVISPGHFKILRPSPLPTTEWRGIRATTEGHTEDWVLFPNGKWINADGSALTQKGIDLIETFEVIR